MFGLKNVSTEVIFLPHKAYTMLSYKDSFAIIQKHLSDFALKREPKELYQPIAYILDIGGKRIRPCMTLMAHSLFCDSPDQAIEPALALEVFHNFTLMHDDIMDNASRRRNVDTVHVKWNENVAILSGDAMLILAYQLLTHRPIKLLPDILRLFNHTALEVCEGQQYDMNFETAENTTVDEYLHMIRLKTAVLIATSLAVGGMVAGTSKENYEALYQFGLHVGLAFQLQDDYLDVFGEGEKFGKTIGNDILANKKTFLLLSALNSGDSHAVQELKNWLQKKNATPGEKIQAVTSIYQQLDIAGITQQRFEDYFNQGQYFLRQVKVPEEQKSALIDLVNILVKREH